MLPYENWWQDNVIWYPTLQRRSCSVDALFALVFACPARTSNACIFFLPCKEDVTLKSHANAIHCFMGCGKKALLMVEVFSVEDWWACSSKKQKRKQNPFLCCQAVGKRVCVCRGGLSESNIWEFQFKNRVCLHFYWVSRLKIGSVCNTAPWISSDQPEIWSRPEPSQ